ncbi:hypothetical protein ACH4F6_22490 [Streptomyces sp. NPDC017936]|uniref:hypothetical protein n=1 Tax=Streptomyces sp. NPDC017936 TaxID=3365016 RepID=UPI00379DF9C1
MAHAAPAPGMRPRSTPSTTRALPPAATPDVFGERTHRIAKWAVPAVLGLVYGYWAAANQRHGGPVTGWNLLFGFVTALVFFALYVAVRALASGMMRELHALLWAVFAGCALGFLVNQTGASVVWSAGMGVVTAFGFFAVLFYRYYTHEDAAGHRIG